MQFEQRLTKKQYIALLEGIVPQKNGTIDLKFRLDVDNRPFQIYDPVRGKTGITHWEKIGVGNGFTRVAFTPITGRTHQQRVHASHPLGLTTPIVGDSLYDSGKEGDKMMLHATSLTFQHPKTEKTLSFDDPPPF